MHQMLPKFKKRHLPKDEGLKTQSNPCFWASQVIKNHLAMQDMWVQSLDQEDPLEEGWQPTPVFLPRKSCGQRSLTGFSPCGSKSQR